MINDTKESFSALKNFFENKSTTLDLSDLIYIDAPLNANNTMTTSMNIKPIVINNSNLTTVKAENLVNQFFRLTGDNLASLTIPQTQIIYDTMPGGNTFSLGNVPSANYRQGFITKTKIRELNMPNLLGAPKGSTPSVSSMPATMDYISFFGNYWLEDIVFGNSFLGNNAANQDTYIFNGLWFYNNYSIRALHLKYPYVISLINTIGLQFSSLNGGKGKIYVPDNLVDEYQKKDNWSAFAENIVPESNYIADAVTFKDSITDSWETILTQRAAAYNLGDTKTFYTNNIPIQMKIVGKAGMNDNPSDPLADGSNNKATFTWAPTNISYFNTIILNNSYASGSERSYNTEEVLKSALATIYEGIPDGHPLKNENGIKNVIKYATGWTASGEQTTISYVGKLWPFSKTEFNLFPPSGSNLQYKNMLLPTYYLGATNFTSYNNLPVAIPLRDITSQTGEMDILQWDTSISTTEMQVKEGLVSPVVFPFFGFCT